MRQVLRRSEWPPDQARAGPARWSRPYFFRGAQSAGALLRSGGENRLGRSEPHSRRWHRTPPSLAGQWRPPWESGSPALPASRRNAPHHPDPQRGGPRWSHSVPASGCPRSRCQRQRAEREPTSQTHGSIRSLSLIDRAITATINFLSELLQPAIQGFFGLGQPLGDDQTNLDQLIAPLVEAAQAPRAQTQQPAA